MTIVLAHPSQSTLLTRRAGPAAARRPSPPCWLAWQRDPTLEVADLRSFYNRERTRTENIKRTVASRRKARAQSPSIQPTPLVEEPRPQPRPTPVPVSAPAPAPIPITKPKPKPMPIQPETQLDLLGMYSSLLESRLQSVERVSKLLSDWREHQPLPASPFPPSRLS